MRFGDGYDAWTMGPRGGGGRFGREIGEFAREMARGARHGGPGGHGGGRRRRVFDGGELRLVLLKLAEDQPRHGYDLIRGIEERTGGAYAPSPGVVYPTLTLLQDMGLIEEHKAEGARKLFAITADGRAQLAEQAEAVTELLARLDALGRDQRRDEASPVRRAMHNLRVVLQQKLRHAEVPVETQHEIAGLIDALAQKVERM